MSEFIGNIVDAVAWKFTDAAGEPYFGFRPYGAFHIAWFTAAVVAAVLLCMLCRNASERTVRISLVAVGGTLVLLECYKQLVMSRATGEWSYMWVAFPWQFCTTPMFVMIAAGLMRPCRLRDGLLCYLSSFSLVAGLAVMIFAGEVFDTALIGVCVQTMVHHGSMIAVGAWMAAWMRGKKSVRSVIWSIIVFLLFEGVAIVLNIVINTAVGAGTVDLYYIAEGGVTDIPVIGDARQAMPYPLYLLCYNLVFIAGGAIVSLLLSAFMPRRRAEAVQ